MDARARSFFATTSLFDVQANREIYDDTRSAERQLII